MAMDEMSAVSCLGIIMDGNRRWAKEKGLASLIGHREGLLKTYKTIAKHAHRCGVKHLVAYMFSTENWNRSVEEVAYLMDLFREVVTGEFQELLAENIRVRFIGQRERFAPDLQAHMAKIEEDSVSKDGMTAWIALSYGGRAEIVAAARSLAATGEEIHEQSLRTHMWSADMPDPDLVIRTGGEMRLSNFLPWQSTYSELFFTPTLWPDFTEAEFDTILAEFAARERRHGK